LLMRLQDAESCSRFLANLIPFDPRRINFRISHEDMRLELSR
jgi:hypothetical protein